MTQPVEAEGVDGMEVINDLAAQLANALKDQAIQRAQLRKYRSQVAERAVNDTPPS